MNVVRLRSIVQSRMSVAMRAAISLANANISNMVRLALMFATTLVV